MIDSLINQIAFDHKRRFVPYARQLEFIENHRYAPVAYLSAGNQTGKTAVGAFIDACHYTGEYPDDWVGPKIMETGTHWVLSTAPKTLINGIQAQLFCEGGFDKVYQAWKKKDEPWPVGDGRGGKIPKRCIVDMKKAPGVMSGNDYIESVTIKHARGKLNTITFFHYGLGAGKLAALQNLITAHFDEIPPLDVYSEVLARFTTTRHGVKALITATPERHADQAMVQMLFSDDWERNGNTRTVISIDDVPDNIISAENKRQRKSLVPERDKPAKLYGQQVSGSMFFELRPEMMRISQSRWMEVKSGAAFSRINGIDFGFNDDSALAALYTNVSTGVVYLERSMKKPWMSPIEFAGAAKKSGFEIEKVPCAWPHDGLRRDKDMTTTKEGRESKKMVAKFYQESGFWMLSQNNKRFLAEANKHAVFAEMESHGKQGMLYVVSGNHEFEEEWRNLQIGDDGKVKGKDHILDAVVAAWLKRNKGVLLKPQKFVQQHAKAPQGTSSHLLR